MSNDTLHPLLSAILISWTRNGAYALRMLDGLTDAQFGAQPFPTGSTLPDGSPRPLMNHPAWIVSHLNIYMPIIGALLTRKPFEDPSDHPFGPKSEISDLKLVYPPRERLIADYARMHAEVETALKAADPTVLTETNPLERWRTMHPRVGDMLVTLVVKHESTHLGQLSAWRRAMGMGRVPV